MEKLGFVALAIAIAAVATCLASYMYIGSELASIRDSVSSVSSFAKMLSVSVSESLRSLSSRVRADEARVSLVERSVSYIQSNFSARISELSSSISTLKQRASTLQASLNALATRIAELGKGLEMASSVISELSNELKALGSRLGALNSSMLREVQSLRSELFALKAEAKKLRSELSGIYREVTLNKANISLALARIASIESEYESLSRALISISNRVSSLEQSVANVSTELSELSTLVRGELEKLKSEIEFVEQWHFAFELRNYSFIHRLLSVAWREPIVSKIVELYGIRGDLLNRAIKAFQYIETHLTYCGDPYEYVATLEGVVSWDDLIQLPNSTIYRGCGDCEDLALLAYSLLRASLEPGEKLYLIDVVWSDSAHVALLAISPKGYALIIDPAGNWLNGVATLIEIKVGNDVMYLLPFDLTSEAKDYLFSHGIAKPLFYDLVTRQIEAQLKPHIWDPETLVKQWISYWGKEPIEINVYGEKTFNSFSNVQSFIQWIQQVSTA